MIANDSISILTFINCPVIDVRNNSFILGSSGNNKGALDLSYAGGLIQYSNAYVGK